jgi:dTMP kinase
VASKPAPFITFEGGEGAGKSTQVRLLKEWLTEQGISVVTSREPGATHGGELIRNLLVQGEQNRWDAETDVLLFMAARRDNLTKIIWPETQKGTWVLCDRFQDSTLAYQCFGRGLERTRVEAVYHFIAGNFKPDLTFLLDIDPRLGVERALKGKNRATHENRFENFDFSFHETLQAAYHTLAKEEPDRFVVIDANRDIETIQQALRDTVKQRFGI